MFKKMLPDRTWPRYAPRIPTATAHGPWKCPGGSRGMITAWRDKPPETFFARDAPLMVSVYPYPYAGEVIAGRFRGKTATTWLLDLRTQPGAHCH